MKEPKHFRIFVDIPTPPDVRAMLEEGTRGHRLDFSRRPTTSVLANAERDLQFAAADVAFGQPDVEAIAEAPQLKWIHVSTSGITRYDNPAFRVSMARRGIMVSNSASVFNEACATHVLSFMLAQARNLPLALQTRTANGTPVWDALRDCFIPLRGQSVVILGYGAIGGRLVEMLRPFEMKIAVYRRKARGDEGVPVVTGAQLVDALAQADHVVNILPGSVETRHFFDARRFAVIKPAAMFYNIGRGTTVDQEALLGALRSGRLGAAWLDVTEPEPLPEGHPLFSEPNCHITPHVAGGHKDELKTLVGHFLDNFARFVRGEPLIDRVM